MSVTQPTYQFESTKPISKYTVVEQYSLTPSSYSLYDRFFLNSTREKFNPDEHLKSVLNKIGLSEILPVKKIRNSVHHNFEMSKQAQKNLREKVTWLYYYAKKQTIITKRGKQLTNFKMNFVTLKLPSEQIHPSDFITKNCLNQLFSEISKKHDFKNYVWRLEYQKNGNLHYHIATDTFIDYHWLLKVWNRILNKYGYVDVYKRKFSQMSLNDYIKSQNYGDKTDFKVLSERYALGCRQGWKIPNTVDVKAVFGKNNIAFYISKYMGKKAEMGAGIKLPVCELNSNNSRLWFCSRSLSKCKKKSDFREVEEVDLFGILKNCDKVRVVYHDYCITLYFSFDDLPTPVKNIVREFLDRYRQEIGYN